MACAEFMLHTLLPHREKYELRVDLGDEPLVIVGMLKFGWKPISVESDIMRLVHNPHHVKWDMKKQTCAYQWYDQTVSPKIIHWKVGGTETYLFEKYDAKVRGLYRGSGKAKVFKDCIVTFVKYKIYARLVKILPWLHKITERIRNK